MDGQGLEEFNKTYRDAQKVQQQLEIQAWAEDIPPEMIDLLAPIIPENYYSRNMRDMIYYFADAPKILYEMHHMFMNFSVFEKTDLLKRLTFCKLLKFSNPI